MSNGGRAHLLGLSLSLFLLLLLLWDEDETEAIIQVDADNAFNRLNRQVALHNIRELCPSFHRYLYNHYQMPAQLIINDHVKLEKISSEEGPTQGDVAAMANYALGITPLVNDLANKIAALILKVKQAWYADDSSAIGKLEAIKVWWDTLCELGPKYGYYPKASKTILILKDIAYLPHAKMLFSNCGLKIVCDGQRHLGAVIGSDAHKTSYVSSKVSKWIEDIKELSKIAVDEPQAALSAYTKGICHRWAFIQRTTPDIGDLFQPLEDVIHETFLPAVIGRKISDQERKILALPVRFGGLGVANPVECADREYNSSVLVTKSLTELLYSQEKDLKNYDREKQNEVVKSLNLTAREAHLLRQYNDISQQLTGPTTPRHMELNREKGAGSWLTCLPLSSVGYCFNKREFRDSICVRYGWKVKDTPTYCGCGKRNSVDHTLICPNGGYVIMRHNNLRDVNAEFQKEVCHDVKVEPMLIPIEGENTQIEGAKEDGAHPDISSRGLWSPFERTFYDVQVIHPNSPSYLDTTPKQLLVQKEKIKMRKYNVRALQVEKGTFTPLLYTTFGGWGPQATAYHRRLADKISKKTKEEYASVMNHMRTRIRFSIMRSVLVALRGQRGKPTTSAKPLAVTSFDLIPQSMAYESY